MVGHMRRLAVLRNRPEYEWPEDAGESLLAALRDGSSTPEERALAVDLAAVIPVMSVDLVDALTCVLQDVRAPEETRANAARALGPVLAECRDGIDLYDDAGPLDEAGIRRVQTVLRSVHEDSGVPAVVRRAVLEASAHAPEEWHFAAIRRAWESKGAEWKETALSAMGFVAGFGREIREGLRSSDPGILREAVRAAGYKQLPEAVAPVTRILEGGDADRDLLLAAIEAAGNLDDADLADLLLPYSQDADDEIADAATDALESLGDEGLGDDEEE